MEQKVRNVVINAALAYELHKGKGDQWRKVFKNELNALPVKAGKVYRFLVAMSEQKAESMDKVVRVLLGA